MSRTGKVFLVGAGPGDPKLITLRALEAIQRADVIVYDRLINPRLLLHAKHSALLIFCGKTAERHTLPQEEINRVLVFHAQKGRLVTRLKGGDPLIFGRGGEEAEYCVEHGISFEIVPGITSGIAAPTYAGIPLTHRDFNSSVTFVTGHKRMDGQDTDIPWDKYATNQETIVFYMGVSNLAYISAQLISYGRAPETPVALVRWGTHGKQESLVGKLSNIVEKVEQAQFTSPAIIVVGEVVQLREKLAWFEGRPLFGESCWIPFAGAKVTDLLELQEELEELGAEVFTAPNPVLNSSNAYQHVDQIFSKEVQQRLAKGKLKKLLFLDVETVEQSRQFVGEDSFEHMLKQLSVLCVGQQTAARLRKYGVAHVQVLTESDSWSEQLLSFLLAQQKLPTVAAQ